MHEDYEEVTSEPVQSRKASSHREVEREIQEVVGFSLQNKVTELNCEKKKEVEYVKFVSCLSYYVQISP